MTDYGRRSTDPDGQSATSSRSDFGIGNRQSAIMTGSIPKYSQLLDILRLQIISGRLPLDQQLPTEEELGAQYGLSRGTVRKAIEQLEAERLIRTEHGVGSFVASLHPRAIPFHFGDWSAASRCPDPEVTHEVLEQRVLPASFDVAERLKIPIGEPVIHLARRRLVGDLVAGYSERTLPEALCPALRNADVSTRSVHELLVTTSMLPLLRAEFEIEAHVLAWGEAELLRCEPGTPAIVITRMTYTAPNRPAVWYRGLFRERYSLDILLDDALGLPASDGAGADAMGT
jgi:DNA-binding GntR family transcriptional regulator